MRPGLTLAVTALALLAGCGGDDEADRLERGEPQLLATARAGLDDALDTAEVLRTDPGQARRLRRRVTRDTLVDEVPSLVDEQARADFLRYATSNPARALRRSAAEAVTTMVVTLDGKDAGERIRTLGGQTVRAYLREAERDAKPVWPDLARRLAGVNLAG